MKHLNLVSVVVAVVLTVGLFSCTTVRPSEDEYYDGPQVYGTYSNDPWFYQTSPYGYNYSYPYSGRRYYSGYNNHNYKKNTGSTYRDNDNRSYQNNQRNDRNSQPAQHEQRPQRRDNNNEKNESRTRIFGNH